MPVIDSKKSDHISRVRQESTNLVKALTALRALNAEWVSLGLSNEIVEDDFVGDNNGLVTADIAAVYTSLAALDVVLINGYHNINFYRVSK